MDNTKKPLTNQQEEILLALDHILNQEYFLWRRWFHTEIDGNKFTIVIYTKRQKF